MSAQSNLLDYRTHVQSNPLIRNSLIRNFAYKKAKKMSLPKLFFEMTYKNSVIRNSVIRKFSYKKHASFLHTRISIGYKKLLLVTHFLTSEFLKFSFSRKLVVVLRK